MGVETTPWRVVKRPSLAAASLPRISNVVPWATMSGAMRRPAKYLGTTPWRWKRALKWGMLIRRPLDDSRPPEESELIAAADELEGAIAALRRAQGMWRGERPWVGAKTWDIANARLALDEADSRLHVARLRLETAANAARRRELENGA